PKPLPRYEERVWPADFGPGGGRKDRQSYRYKAFVPDAIARLQLMLPADVAAIVGEAERAVAALNAGSENRRNLEVLARRLLRSESVASSRIEGLVLSHRRLARAEFVADGR